LDAYGNACYVIFPHKIGYTGANTYAQHGFVFAPHKGISTSTTNYAPTTGNYTATTATTFPGPLNADVVSGQFSTYRVVGFSVMFTPTGSTNTTQGNACLAYYPTAQANSSSAWAPLGDSVPTLQKAL